MSECGWDALPDVREWSEVPPGCSGVVWRSSRMSGSGWGALPEVQETLSDVQGWSGGPPGCLEVVEMPFR